MNRYHYVTKTKNEFEFCEGCEGVILSGRVCMCDYASQLRLINGNLTKEELGSKLELERKEKMLFAALNTEAGLRDLANAMAAPIRHQNGIPR